MIDFNFEHLRDELAMDQGEALILYSIVRAIKPKVCLEIGTHKGYSTNHIIQALKDNGEGHLTTTDPYDYGAKNTITFEDRKWCDFLDKMGKDVKLKEKIDFAFIDGLHTVFDVVPEIENLLPQLSDDAVVVFHDAQNEKTNLEDGVNAAIKRCKLKTTWIPTQYGLQIYQKRKVI